MGMMKILWTDILEEQKQDKFHCPIIVIFSHSTMMLGLYVCVCVYTFTYMCVYICA